MNTEENPKGEKIDKIPADQRSIVNITLGKTPQNDYERELAADIERIKKAGYIVDIPFD